MFCRRQKTGHHGSARGWRAAASAVALVVLAVIFVVLSPVIVFLVLPLAMAAYRGRLRAAARAFKCLSCGGILGLESLHLADAAFRELCSRRPDNRVRLVRCLHAICPACGTRYTFVERDRTFVSAPDDRT